MNQRTKSRMWESCLSGSERGRGTTDVWNKYCGTVGKPDGNRENKYDPAASEVPCLLGKTFLCRP